MKTETKRQNSPAGKGKSAAQRKREQLQRDAAAGYRQIYIKVHESQREVVRAFVESLPEPA